MKEDMATQMKRDFIPFFFAMRIYLCMNVCMYIHRYGLYLFVTVSVQADMLLFFFFFAKLKFWSAPEAPKHPVPPSCHSTRIKPLKMLLLVNFEATGSRLVAGGWWKLDAMKRALEMSKCIPAGDHWLLFVVAFWVAGSRRRGVGT